MNGLEALKKIENSYREQKNKLINDPFIHLHERMWFLAIEKELKAYHRLIKAIDLKQPIFVKDFQGVCEFDDTIVSSRFITNGNQLALVDDFGGESMYLNLNEYGETWALTKEELE